MATKVVGKVDTISLKFKWEIDKFSASCIKNVGCLESPGFTANSDDIQWYLRLYPNGKTENYKQYLSLFLHTETAIKAVCNMKILSGTNGKVVANCTTHEHVFGTSGKGFNKFILRELVTNPVNGALKDDKLTILCEITYRDDKALEQHVQECDIVSRLEVIDKYEALLGDGKFSDVSFVAEGRAVNVHKCILVKSSPVFAAMFDAELKVKQENIVDTVDMKYNVLIEMMRFIYAGKVNNIDALANELALAADKYALHVLKNECEIRMSNNLSLENVIYCIQLADKLSMANLKEAAIKFVVENASEIVDKSEFYFLPDDIVRKAFCSLAKKKKCN